MRKLRVLLEGLPPDAPAFWLETPNGARTPWTLADAQIWRMFWATATAATGLSGVDKGKSIFDSMPQFPWSKPVNQSSYGSFGDHSPEEVLDYLDSL